MLLEHLRVSASPAAPLRIGILLDSPVLAQWFAEVVDQIQQSSFARIELLVYNTEERAQNVPQAPRPLWRKLIDTATDTKRRKNFAFDLYQRLDARSSPPRDRNPHTPIDSTERFAGIPTIDVTPQTKRFVHRFPAEAVADIRSRNLDVLLRFGFNILRGDILTAARYGIWSYHHGDNDFYRGGPAYFWEVYERNPISGAILQVLTEELDGGKVLYKGLFATEPGLSQIANRVQPYWGASSFILQKLRELHQYGWEHVERNGVPNAPYQGKKKIYVRPTNAEMVRWLAPEILVRSARRLTRRPTVLHWRMAYRTGEKGLLDSAGAPNLNGFRFLEAPAGHFYADPFLLKVEGKPWLFFEDYDYAATRGSLACAEWKGQGIGPVVPVLSRPYHLSYPCVFPANGNLYLVPESGAAGVVELYRCVRFPDRWEKECDLLRAKAVDTTVFQSNGLFWFFTTLKEPRGGAMQLWLFHSKSVTGPWTPHPASPLSTDVRNARGAGAVIEQNGRLYRPSQDCSQAYGYSFTLNEIQKLDSACYQEAKGVPVLPCWAPGLIATHSYSRLGNVEVIDGCVRLPASRVGLP